MGDIIDTQVNKQFTQNTNITNKWVNVKWNNSHNVCTINLGREGVDIKSFIDIVENKCNVASANHIEYNHTNFNQNFPNYLFLAIDILLFKFYPVFYPIIYLRWIT